jgi:small subunit ribosomal protein S13
MPRILGALVPNDKPTWIALRSIYGIGPSLSLQLCGQAKIDPSRLARDLSDDEIARVVGLLDREYTVEGSLRREIQKNLD